MTKLSDSGHSLRPDGQLRSMYGNQLLFKWEVKSASVPMSAAVTDLKGESGNPNGMRPLYCHSKESCSKPACMAQPVTDVVTCMSAEDCYVASSHLSLSAPAAKMGQWSPLYYGDLPYLMAATAAENKLQFHVILCNAASNPVAVSPQMNLATPAGRAQAVVAVINLHRLLHGVKACLPAYVLPLDHVDVREHPEDGYRRTL